MTLVSCSVHEEAQVEPLYAICLKALPRLPQGPGAAPEAKPPAPKPEDAKPADAESKFKAFTGRPRSLRD